MHNLGRFLKCIRLHRLEKYRSPLDSDADDIELSTANWKTTIYWKQANEIYRSGYLVLGFAMSGGG